MLRIMMLFAALVIMECYKLYQRSGIIHAVNIIAEGNIICTKDKHHLSYYLLGGIYKWHSVILLVNFLPDTGVFIHHFLDTLLV